MSVTMPGPWKHSTTGTYYLKQRVPHDLVAKAKGTTVNLMVDGVTYPVKIGGQVKVSLRTKEIAEAKRRHREADDALQLNWDRLRSGTVDLSHRQVLALAGEVAKGVVSTFYEDPGEPEVWKQLIRSNVKAGAVDDYRGAMERWIGPTVDELLEAKRLQVSDRNRDELLYRSHVALTEASIDTLQKAEGDYRSNPALERYPDWTPPDRPIRTPSGNRQTITGLFQEWEREQAQAGKSGSTARRWKPLVVGFVKYLGHDDAESVKPDDIVEWRAKIVETGAQARTFNRIHLCAVRAIYRQGMGKRLVGGDPTAGLKFPASKPVQTRPKGFTKDEALTILRAADDALGADGRTSDLIRRAQRWVPWLCAYTGARVGEITQLRREDVTNIDGVMCIRISPEAGTVKTGNYRDVPLHSHLIDKGFVEFVRERPKGPLFYSRSWNSDAPWSITGGKLRDWVRETVGIDDPKVKPNHGWRHAFQTAGRNAGIDRFYRNEICGQSVGRTVGDDYGDTPVPTKKREIEKLPRWEP